MQGQSPLINYGNLNIEQFREAITYWFVNSPRHQYFQINLSTLNGAGGAIEAAIYEVRAQGDWEYEQVNPSHEILRLRNTVNNYIPKEIHFFATWQELAKQKHNPAYHQFNYRHVYNTQVNFSGNTATLFNEHYTQHYILEQYQVIRPDRPVRTFHSW